VLLAGPAGLGKRELARALVARILCREARGDQPACGRCRACEQQAAGSHADFALVTLELRDNGTLRTELTVDQIRALSARLALTPQQGGYQIALIDPADAMNVNAANALLKTLEEPSQDTLLILVTDQPGNLPATILSRCARVEVRFPQRGEALTWLASRGVGSEAAETALTLAAAIRARRSAMPATWREVDEVAKGLVELLSGRAPPSALAARWADEHAPLRLRVLAQCLRLLARHRNRAQRSPPRACARPPALASGVESRSYGGPVEQIAARRRRFP
jgi:DNA polymerase-3 subunit delta'